MKKSMSMIGITVGVVLVLLIVSRPADSGTLDPSSAPAPTMVTLQDIYQKLLGHPNASPGGSLDPTNAPAPTMVTLQSIYDAIVVRLKKTGQTTSFRAGDDGDLEKGVASPVPRFTDHGNGTVTDNLTGLMWVKAPLTLPGNDKPWPSGLNWNSAIDLCRNLTYAGHSDWRLPNAHEQLSLIDYSKNHPALPAGHPFVGLQFHGFWTSTTSSDYTPYAWYVASNGSLAGKSKGESLTIFALPVRGGQ
jgi:hypothetical protein